MLAYLLMALQYIFYTDSWCIFSKCHFLQQKQLFSLVVQRVSPQLINTAEHLEVSIPLYNERDQTRDARFRKIDPFLVDGNKNNRNISQFILHLVARSCPKRSSSKIDLWRTNF